MKEKVRKAGISPNAQSKTYYASNKKKKGTEWEQNIFNDSGADLNLVGGAKAEKDKVTLYEPPEKMEVEDVQGNEVKISGIEEYYIAEEPGGQKVRTHFYVADEMEGDDLLIGLTTMNKWGIIKKNFPNNDSERFLQSDEKTKTLQHHINRISAVESAKSENEGNDDEANSKEVNKAEGDEVTVNLTEKESSQKGRKEEHTRRKKKYKLEK